MESEEEIKTFYGRCRCCLEYGYMKSMWKKHMWDDEPEIYGEMLMETFNIAWDSDSSDEHICEACIKRLRDAYHFKKDVLCAEHMLRDNFDEDVIESVTLKDALFTEEDDDVSSVNMDQQVKMEQEDDFESVDDQAEFGEIEFLEEDAELVEQSVNTLEKETDSDEAPKKKWPQKKKRPERSSYRNYTQTDLKKCLEAVQNQGLSQSEAARKFNIPTKTVNVKMLSLLKKQDDESDRQENRKAEIKKHRDNIQAILTYTNATAIRDHRGLGYQCYFCPKHYQHPADLKRHSLTHKNAAKNFKIPVLFNYTVKIDITGLKCRLCHSDIDDLSLEEVMEHLKVHEKTVHMDIKNHILPFKFDSEHLKCIICDETFAYFKLLAAHMSEHYPNYKCEECGKGFVNKHARRSHASRHVMGEFPCSICDKIFSTRTRKRDHERVVHVLRNKAHKCSYCTERFTDTVQRSHHEVSHHGVEPPQFCCQYCDKIFESQRSLTSHVKRCHLQLKPHECQYCLKRFFKKSAMQSHVVSHTGEKKYKCMKCDKLYASRSALVKHIKTHTDVKIIEKPTVEKHTDSGEKRHSTFCFDCGMVFEREVFLSHECKGAPSIAERLYEDGEIIM